MTPEQEEKMSSIIEKAVQGAVTITVNGKIREIKVMLEDHIKAEDLWKETAAPAIALGTNLTGFGKVIAYMLSILAGFGALGAFIIELLKFIFHHRP